MTQFPSRRFRRARLMAAATLLATVATTACAPFVRGAPRYAAPEFGIRQMGSAAQPALRVTDHVVIVSVDGLRPDAIKRFGASTMQRLMNEGSWSLTARTVEPSTTLPSHTSMLTGVEPAVHGINWNSDRTEHAGHVEVPTVFGLASSRGLTTAAFFGKAKFHHLDAPQTIDHVSGPRGTLNGARLAEHTLEALDDHFRTTAPNLTFVHIGEPDYAGHLYGWMSGMYGRAVREADDAVARVLEMATARFGTGNFTVIVTADHGGSGRSHGTTSAEDTTIPWIAWGAGVERRQLPRGIQTMDTAATALWLLGVPLPATFRGRTVAAAFTPSSIAVATAADGGGR
jgi:arylsulfatase A-like enzyme